MSLTYNILRDIQYVKSLTLKFPIEKNLNYTITSIEIGDTELNYAPRQSARSSVLDPVTHPQQQTPTHAPTPMTSVATAATTNITATAVRSNSSNSYAI